MGWQIDHRMYRRIFCGIGLAALALPVRASANDSLAYFMTLPGFTNLAFTIALVNRRMREASENPLDRPKRAALHQAMARMPAALLGLAVEFKNGKLHDHHLPLVQGV